MTLIADPDSLAAFCSRQAAADFIAVDTEFMRDKTYWPQLCLVQVAGPDEAAAIDPLAPGMDLAPLVALMDEPRIVKVFHAARQDIEIFFHMTGRIPEPLFDTQVAAMVCGFGESVSYETLASKLAGARIDKSSRFTDWAQRPLTQRQLTYALSDVTHLRPSYEKIRRRLEKSGRGEWLDEEMNTLLDPGTYRLEPAEAWRRFKVRGGSARFLAVLKEVAAWRERTAQEKNLPRGRMLRDEAVLEIAAHHPRTVDELARTRGLGKGLAEGRYGGEILEAVARALDLPDADLPKPPPREDTPPGLGPLVELLRVLLKMKCEDAEVAQKLVASADDLERIAASDAADVPAMHGWRRDIFGQHALALKHGRLALTARGKSIAVVPLPGPG
ncbi:MAG: ribonuclease D [Alphaproteobacteria bacterium]